MLRAAWVVFGKEVREALRDVNTLTMSLLFPLFLYPMMVWGGGEIYAWSRSDSEGERYRVGTSSEEARELLTAVEGPFDAVPIAAPVAGSDDQIDHRTDDQAPYDRAIVDGQLDVILEAEEKDGGDRVTLRYASLSRRSSAGASRLERALEEEGDARALFLGRSLGVDRDLLDLSVDRKDVGGVSNMIAFLLSLVVPYSLILMGLVSAMYPAVEVVVGERERGTLETQLVSGAPRVALVVGKLLAVFTIALVGTLINLGALLLTLRHTMALLELDISFDVQLPPATLVWLSLLTVLSTIFSGVLCLVAVLPTRSFKQGQNAATLVVTVGSVLSILGILEHSRLEGAFLYLPYTNLVLLMRYLISAEPLGNAPSIVVGETLLLSALGLGVGLSIVTRESWLFGAGIRWNGLFRRKP